MKPWEETWTRVLWMHDHNQDPIFGIESDAIQKGVDDHFCEFDAGEHARSQLATAAPEMARALVEVLASMRRTMPSQIEEQCDAALRKAGVPVPSDT